jgi:hypothetical protein
MKGLITVLAVLVVLGVGFLLYSSPSAPPEMTEAETAAIQAEVLDAAEAWIDAWKDMETDCETAADSWHPEHMAFFFGGHRVDKAGWIDYCNQASATRASWAGSWTNPEIRVLSPDAALFVSSYEQTISYNNDAPTRHYPTSGQVILFERTPTGWGITTFSNFNGPSEVVEEG